MLTANIVTTAKIENANWMLGDLFADLVTELKKTPAKNPCTIAWFLMKDTSVELTVPEAKNAQTVFVAHP